MRSLTKIIVGYLFALIIAVVLLGTTVEAQTGDKHYHIVCASLASIAGFDYKTKYHIKQTHVFTVEELLLHQSLTHGYVSGVADISTLTRQEVARSLYTFRCKDEVL